MNLQYIGYVVTFMQPIICGGVVSPSIASAGLNENDQIVPTGRHQGRNVREEKVIPLVGGKTGLLGMELETVDQMIINADFTLKKGQVIANTVRVVHGYPIISLTVEIGDFNLPMLELVTAPLSLKDHQHLQVFEKCAKILDYLSQTPPHEGKSLADIVDWYNRDVVDQDALNECLNMEINHKPISLRNDQGIIQSPLARCKLTKATTTGIVLHRIKSDELPRTGKTYRHTNFLIPYKNIGNLHDLPRSSEMDEFLDGENWRMSHEGAIFLSELLGLETLDDNTRSAFMRWFYNCIKIITKTVKRKDKEKKVLLKFLFQLNSRITTYQEIMELLPSDVIHQIITRLINDPYHGLYFQIEDYLLGDPIVQNHEDLDHLKQWLSHEISHLVRALRIRYVFGCNPVYDFYLSEPYIISDENKKIILPNYTPFCLADFLTSSSHSYNDFAFKVQRINNKPYVVVEFRVHQESSKKDNLPFNSPEHLFDPSNPTVLEQQIMDFLFKEKDDVDASSSSSFAVHDDQSDQES